MKPQQRIVILLLFFVCFTLIIILRLFYWQFIKADELKNLAANQQEVIKLIPASRGKIISADGFPLATNKKAYLLFADLTKISREKLKEISFRIAPFFFEEKEATFSAQEQKELLKEKEDFLLGLLSQSGNSWVPLRHKLTSEQKEEIEKMSIEGLGFEEEWLRYYPEASLAAHLLGFVGSDFSGKPTGYFGLEGYYDLELKGKDGYLLHEKDAINLPILTGFFAKKEKKDGKDIKLYVNRTVQIIVEEELKSAVEKYGAKSGWVIVMEPESGAILSIAAYPKYDQSKFSEFSPEIYKNPALSEVYEPGSTFKVIVMAAALNEGAVSPETKCSICDGPYKIDKYVIETWNKKYHPNQTMTEVIKNSDNIGMIYAINKLGKEKFLRYLDKFGFREKTGIDLEEEINSSIKTDKEWTQVDLTTAAFGQGLAITGIQMVRAVGAIANKGMLMEPHLVQEIIGGEKTLYIKPKAVRQVIMPQVAQQITDMMIYAVEMGEAKWAKPKGYKIAGKTGTAQIPVAGHYDKEKTIASFIGFAPANNPKFVMLTYLREPTTSPWGSETAAPLFFNIAKKLLIYYAISPEE